MLFLLLSTGLAFASTDSKSCAIHLSKSSESMPMVEVNLLRKRLDPFATDQVAAKIDWSQLFGRSVRVAWQFDGKTIFSTTQDVYSRPGLIEKYPDLRASANAILSEFNATRAQLERTFAYACVLPILKRIGFRKGVLLAERCAPGEFSKLVLRMPTEVWESEQLSSWSQQKSALGRLFAIDATGIVNALKERLKEFAYDYNSLPRPLLRIYLVHNHPGVMDPLSVTDLMTQQRMADLLSKHEDQFDFELVFVALAHLEEPGDIAFVRTVSRIQNEGGRSSTWTADGEAHTYVLGGRNRLKPKLNPPRRPRAR